MTLDQLRVFVAVAERQHVTRAAEALNIAQSAVSAAIAALESRHDAKLFHRIGRGIALTDAGMAFLPEARAVLGRAGAAEQVLAEFGTLSRGRLTIHASHTIASYWLPRRLVAFRQVHPGIELALRIGNSAEVVAAVSLGECDLGFVEGDIDAPLLQAETVAKDQLLVLVGMEHPWAGRADPPDSAELAAADWVLRERGSGTRAMFEMALAALGIAPALLRVVLELPSNGSVRGAAEAGMGVTALSASVAAASIEAGLLHRVDVALPPRSFLLLSHTERHASRAAAAFATSVRPGDAAARPR